MATILKFEPISRCYGCQASVHWWQTIKWIRSERGHLEKFHTRCALSWIRAGILRRLRFIA